MCLRDISGTGHMCLELQLSEDKQKTFTSPSRNTVEKNKKLKTKIWPITNLFVLHANVVRQAYKNNEIQTIKIQK